MSSSQSAIKKHCFIFLITKRCVNDLIHTLFFDLKYLATAFF